MKQICVRKDTLLGVILGTIVSITAISCGMDHDFRSLGTLGIGSTKEAFQTVFFDSFEQPLGQSPLGFREVIDDRGRGGAGVGADPVATNSAVDGNQVLGMYGRPGASVHDIYVVSGIINLSKYVRVRFNFKQLNCDLELNEVYELRVCKGSAASCGVTPTSANAAQLGDNSKWDVIWSLPDSQKANGRNSIHNRSDWETVDVQMNLGSNKGEFVFVLRSRMDEGPVIFSNWNSFTKDCASADAFTLYGYGERPAQ